MNIVAIAALLTFVPIGLAVVFLYRTLASRPDSEASLDQCLVLSLEKYRPMERLLCEDDFLFLAGRSGFSASLGKRFRAERRRIFRGYLRSLKRDFSRVSTALEILVVHSGEDRADLAASVMRQRLLFAVGLLAIEGRLLLHAAGFGTVDVSDLVVSLDTMQAQIRILLAPPQTAAGIA